MTRSEAWNAIFEVVRDNPFKSSDLIASKVLDALDPCLAFTPEVAEMSAVCHGVARVANEE